MFSPTDWAVSLLLGLAPCILLALLSLLRPRPSLPSLLAADNSLPLLPTSSTLALTSLSLVSVLGEVGATSSLVPWTSLLAATIALLTLPHLLLPVLHKARLATVYEYLELRFSSCLLRRLASLSFTLASLVHLALLLVLPLPSLARITGLPAPSLLACLPLLSVVAACSGLAPLAWASVAQLATCLGGLGVLVVALWPEEGGGHLLAR